MSHRTVRLLLMLGAFATGLVLFTAVILIVRGPSSAPVVSFASAVGGPFKLISHTGQPVTEQSIRGKPHLVFFGFTHCPDVCPTTLFEVSEILRALGKDADRVGALFVTVDPERDTPQALKDYLLSFDPHLVALTGDAAAVRGIEKAYRVYSKKIPLDGGGYTMDHTAIVYLMDKDGRFVAPFNVKRKPDEAAAELRRHI